MRRTNPLHHILDAADSDSPDLLAVDLAGTSRRRTFTAAWRSGQWICAPKDAIWT